MFAYKYVCVCMSGDVVRYVESIKYVHQSCGHELEDWLLHRVSPFSIQETDVYEHIETADVPCHK